MGCYKPLDVPRPGKWHGGRRFIQVPCGSCIGCKVERARQWTVRLEHESQLHDKKSFLTLTLDDKHLVYGETQATLDKRCLQLFWKRLRKEYNVPIRYFACGEYGSGRSRPHYHALVFGLDFPDKTLACAKDGNNYYSSDCLNRVWGNGFASVGDVTPQSIAYVARYILDKRQGIDYKRLGIEPEFVTMSRRPGIGRNWYDQFAGDIYPHDFCITDGGRRSRPPRYYDVLRKEQFPGQMKDIKARRIELLEANYDERTIARLMAKEQYAILGQKNIRILH